MQTQKGGMLAPYAMQDQMRVLSALQQGNTQPYGPMSYTQMTKGSPDAMMSALQSMQPQASGQNGYGPKGDEAPGMNKGPMGGGNGGGQPGGGGNGDPRFNMFSWQGFAGLPGVREGDLGSIMRYYANQAAQQPRPLNMGQFFGHQSQPGQQR